LISIWEKDLEGINKRQHGNSTMNDSSATSTQPASIPPADPARDLVVARPDKDRSLPTSVWWATPTTTS